ncbi:hypothetical protein RKD23_007129 [Streptomyces sp. SAI-170]|uniref:hypothetical protein n=1 Tax=Streptomyces sp. SAI-170 TaxID=3377729 RepID=UPI003C7D735B
MTAQLTTGLRTLVVSAVPGARPRRLRQSAEAGGASAGHQPSHVVALRRDMRGVIDPPRRRGDGEPAFVHRHNAARARTPEAMTGHPAFAHTGRPLLVPGPHRTSSLVCVPVLS